MGTVPGFEWTHFDVPTQTAFGIEKCEVCGRDCEAANAAGIRLRDAERFQLTIVHSRLPELVYSEKLQAAVCPTCDQGAR